MGQKVERSWARCWWVWAARKERREGRWARREGGPKRGLHRILFLKEMTKGKVLLKPYERRNK
jgi:hypothetical protein